MIDMLGLTSEHPPARHQLNKLKDDLGLSSFGVLDRNYRYTEIFKKDKEFKFWLKHSPRQSNLKEAQLLINPSRYSGYSEVTFIVNSILRGEVNINRVDLCSDLNIPIDEFQSRMRIKNKQKVTEYAQGLDITGFYFGTKNEIITIYDKSRELEKFRRFKLSKLKYEIVGRLTRVENRLRGCKIPFKLFKDLPRYKEFNPFSKVQIIDFKDDSEFKNLTRQKAKMLAELSKEIGFHKAFRAFNSSNNSFNRTMSKYVVGSQLNNELLNRHLKELGDFLRG